MVNTTSHHEWVGAEHKNQQERVEILLVLSCVLALKLL